jgi:hypothetical protein
VRAVEFSAAEQSETGKTADLVGGKARARALTKARQEITGTAAVARWGKKV